MRLQVPCHGLGVVEAAHHIDMIVCLVVAELGIPVAKPGVRVRVRLWFRVRVW